ncbi:unknown protein [Bathycoccus prasinos]|uniref:Uncharacterized protein n=1 Tax=Bathycoccus prasinos TaxID=41875 RepID=K8ESE0_9CHLO|nr:unknown protein [Bathycoccus prasinos]CCO15340.1 unknown protein [Bathycoccus prasinos]|eukprot:XP_007513903.1 unknown protein [Bathycoccus prasinos]
MSSSPLVLPLLYLTASGAIVNANVSVVFAVSSSSSFVVGVVVKVIFIESSLFGSSPSATKNGGFDATLSPNAFWWSSFFAKFKPEIEETSFFSFFAAFFFLYASNCTVVMIRSEHNKTR